MIGKHYHSPFYIRLIGLAVILVIIWWGVYFNKKISNMKNLSVLILLVTLAFSASMVIQIPNGQRLTIQDVQRIIQLWNRYFKVLEKQGLTTESDRRRIDQLNRITNLS